MRSQINGYVIGPADPNSALSQSLSSDAPIISGTIYLIDNTSALDGPLSTLSSRRPSARALSLSGTSSARPRGVARSYGHGGKPALLFSSSEFQYAQDQAADAAAVVAPLTAAGSGFVARVTLSGTGPIVGNWGGVTSNENSFQLEFSASEILTIYVTNKAAGAGTTLINASTTAGAVRYGDTVTITFLHQSDRTWTVKILREPRDNETTTTTINLSGGPYSPSPINTDAPLAGLTLGAYRALGTFGSVVLHSFIAFTIGATTSAEVAAYEAWIAARCAASRVEYTASDPLQSADWDQANDKIHPQSYVRVANVGKQLEQAVYTRLGLARTANVGVVGDSRAAGPAYNRTLGVDDLRALLQAGATIPRTAVGPIDDLSGAASAHHFAISAYVTRGFGAQLGHSPYTPTAATLDNYVGTGKAFNYTDIWLFWIGYNDLTGANITSLDWVYELERILLFVHSAQSAEAAAQRGVVPGFALIGEPATYVTATGALQRRLRARNHQMRVMASALNARGIIVEVGNINDWTRGT